MHKFRNFVRSHLSKQSLLTLVFVGLLSLGYAGQSFVSNVGTIFAEIDLDIVPTIRLASLHQSVSVARLPNTPPPSREVADRSLALGERSKDVLLLQNFLKWRGFWPEAEPTSAYFGEVTLSSVKKYQEAVKIEPEGIVGPLTRDAWRNDVGGAI
ncbi:MAG: peptidoglycan-binding protein [Patescibacteria group bacterium]